MFATAKAPRSPDQLNCALDSQEVDHFINVDLTAAPFAFWLLGVASVTSSVVHTPL
jgi:hypothetical protein